MHFKKRLMLSIIAAGCLTSSYAAIPYNLRTFSFENGQSFMQGQPGISFQEISRSKDFNHTTHIRLQETYAGIKVFGGDIVQHIPAEATKRLTPSFNGLIYLNLYQDLRETPPLMQYSQAIDAAVSFYQKKYRPTNMRIHHQKSDPIIFIDDKHDAHWAYLIHFDVRGEKIAKPHFILDAKTFKVYREWDNLKTSQETVLAGGFGGNSGKIMGKLTYDGLDNHLPALNMLRDGNATCYLKNSDVIVLNRQLKDTLVSFSCALRDPDHKIYWDGDHDAVNGGYSPSNDALYIGRVIQDMYQKWYHIPPLSNPDGTKMDLVMRVHERGWAIDNAYWDDETSQMTFGDGKNKFYPLTSLGVGAHEISHGFTHQHSDLIYQSQSGGLNESFSDMAAQAAEFYSLGHNSWEIGPEIMLKEGTALRYMIKPSQDCGGMKLPGHGCSIDEMSQYREGLNPHYSSGLFNRVFYLISSAPNWDTKKAFDIMVQANANYWTSNSTFKEAACGVLQATMDYQYDTSVVQQAFATVGLNTLDC